MGTKGGQMTEDRLRVIEAQCRISNRYVAVGDVLALVAEVRRLRADNERLRGLIKEAEGFKQTYYACVCGLEVRDE